MGDPLHDRRPLDEWVSGEQVIEISGNIGEFERLADAVRADLAESEEGSEAIDLRDIAVSGSIRFSRAGPHDGHPRVTGEIETVLPATCQRCLKTFRLPVATALRFELVGSGDAKPGSLSAADNDDFETWELGDGAVRPADIVDEALVMAMPLVAKHEAGDDCIRLDAADDGPEMTSPFASLRAQMDEANKD